MTKERPILMSAPMVRALLAGTKTQTRRAVKLPHTNPLGKWEPMEIGGPNGGRTFKGETIPLQQAIWHTRTGDSLMCPHGMPGDRLWVREAWRVGKGYDDAPGSSFTSPSVWYEADPGEPRTWISGRYRHGRFMPRWASRITLEVIGVRVERLWAISRADVVAEGCDGYELTYAKLWESINGAGSWDANPWVWVIEFRRVGAA